MRMLPAALAAGFIASLIACTQEKPATGSDLAKTTKPTGPDPAPGAAGQALLAPNVREWWPPLDGASPSCRKDVEFFLSDAVDPNDPTDPTHVQAALVCALDQLPPEQVEAFEARFATELLRRDGDKEANAAGAGPTVLTSAANGLVHRVDVDKLGAGTMWSGFRISRKKGHYDATVDAVLRQGQAFSADARTLLADASQDPDLFAWTVMAAHAQTPDENGKPSVSTEQAEAATVAFVTQQQEEARQLCREGKPEAVKRALYRLGYSLHPVEDLAPHRGRTNSEHAYNAAHEKNPDDDGQAYALAVELASDYLTRVMAGRLSPCREAFRSYQGDRVHYLEKVRELGHSPDLKPSTLLAYKRSAAQFAAVMGTDGMRVRWFGPLPPQTEAPDSCRNEPACAAILDRFAAPVVVPAESPSRR